MIFFLFYFPSFPLFSIPRFDSGMLSSPKTVRCPVHVRPTSGIARIQNSTEEFGSYT